MAEQRDAAANGRQGDPHDASSWRAHIFVEAPFAADPGVRPIQQIRRMGHPLIRSIGIGLLAGFSGAAFGSVAAGLLHLSRTIAGAVSGLSLAVIVAILTYRHRPGPSSTEP